MFAWLKPKPASDWRTVAVHSFPAHQIDWQKNTTKYTASYVFKVDQYDNRKVECRRDNIAWTEAFDGFMRGTENYLLKVAPWLEGTLTLEEVAATLPDLNIIGVRL